MRWAPAAAQSGVQGLKAPGAQGGHVRLTVEDGAVPFSLEERMGFS